MFSFFNSKPSAPLPLPTSQLFDEQTFYAQVTKDLRNAQSEVIIESPFITKGRVVSLIPVFTELLKRKVKIFIITRPSHEHEEVLARQADGLVIENAGLVSHGAQRARELGRGAIGGIKVQHLKTGEHVIFDPNQKKVVRIR